MASDSGTISGFARECTMDANKYWNMWYYADTTWDESYSSNNTLTCSNFKVTLRRVATDVGYTSTCGWEDDDYVSGCATNFQVYVATSLSSAPGWSSKGSYSYRLNYPTATIGTYSIPGTLTIAPGGSTTIAVAKGGACTSETRTITLRNTRSAPTPTPPTVTSVSASCSNTNPDAISVSGSINLGWSQITKIITLQVKDTKGNYITGKQKSTNAVSGSYSVNEVFSGLQPNSQYTVTLYANAPIWSNADSRTTTVITPFGISISDVTATAWDAGSVRIIPVMGGGYSSTPTHTIQIAKAGTSTWKTVATSHATVPTVIEIPGLEAETTYQVKCITSGAGTCTSTSQTLQFTTSKKGICQANFSSMETATDATCSQTTADICYTYETTLTPATITVYYRIKNGYDDTWLVADERTLTKDSGSVCFTLEGLFPNQVVYEAYIHTHTEELEWDGEISEFTTPLCPEVVSYNCESLTYMTEYLCAAINQIKNGGNMTMFANPYSLQLCEPGNVAPTHLTLWTRYLRLSHAYLCILCDFMNLSHANPDQYLVGEIGWITMLHQIVESQMESDGWKLATSDATYKYIQDKLKEVWHYQGTVDVLVAEKSELVDYTNAKTAIVTSENAIYKKSASSWVKDTSQTPEDFGVWHINYESKEAKAESGWYYWQGTWNNLDADLEYIEKQVEEIEEKLQGNVVDAGNSTASKLYVVPADHTFAPYADPDGLYIVTDMAGAPDTVYHTVTFTAPDGRVLNTVKIADGLSVYTPTFNLQEGFIGNWFWNGQQVFCCNTRVTQDMTLVGQLEPSYKEITFMTSGDVEGTPPDPIQAQIGSTVDLPSGDGLSLVGYTFKGWQISGSAFNPIWQDSFRVTHDVWGLTAAWKVDYITLSVQVSPNEPATITEVPYGYYYVPEPPASRDGYRFVGWKLSDGVPFNSTQPLTTNTSLVAEWANANVTVSFSLEGYPGTDTPEVPASQTIAYYEWATEPTVEAAGGVVDYWTLNGVRYDFDMPVTENITLVAVWTQIVEVTFDANGGSPTPEPQQVKVGDYAIEPTAPTKKGCEFIGWEEEVLGPLTAEQYDALGLTAATYDAKELTAEEYDTSGSILTKGE